jgi:hypothetical protein
MAAVGNFTFSGSRRLGRGLRCTPYRSHRHPPYPYVSGSQTPRICEGLSDVQHADFLHSACLHHCALHIVLDHALSCANPSCGLGDEGRATAIQAVATGQPSLCTALQCSCSVTTRLWSRGPRGSTSVERRGGSTSRAWGSSGYRDPRGIREHLELR